MFKICSAYVAHAIITFREQKSATFH